MSTVIYTFNYQWIATNTECQGSGFKINIMRVLCFIPPKQCVIKWLKSNPQQKAGVEIGFMPHSLYFLFFANYVWTQDAVIWSSICFHWVIGLWGMLWCGTEGFVKLPFRRMIGTEPRESVGVSKFTRPDSDKGHFCRPHDAWHVQNLCRPRTQPSNPAFFSMKTGLGTQFRKRPHCSAELLRMCSVFANIQRPQKIKFLWPSRSNSYLITLK